MQLPKPMVTVTPSGASADVDGIFVPGADVQAQHGAGLLARGEERIPVAAVDARQAEVRGDLGEADRAHTARRVALDLGGGELRVPQRDEAQRDEPTAARRRTTPRPSSRCTPRTHSSASSRSLASRNVWPQNRGKFGKHSDACVQFASMSCSRAAGS